MGYGRKGTVEPCFLGVCIKNVFDSVVVGAFQITFRAKIHANDIFLFLKNYF
jgi:hypothetical protein